MPDSIELIIALLIPFITIVWLRINAAMVFLSVCLGYVLVELVAKDANSLITFLAPSTESISATTWYLIMLLLPVVLTCIFTAFSIKDRFKTIVNAFPAAAVSVLLLLLAIPLFTPGLRFTLQSQELWQHLYGAQAMIVGIGALISLLFIWTTKRSSGKAGGGK